MSTYEERRGKRFYVATIAALKDIHDRGMQLPNKGATRGHGKKRIPLPRKKVLRESRIKSRSIQGQDKSIN